MNAMKKSKEKRCQCCNKTLTAENHLVFGDDGKRRNIAAVLFDYIGKTLNEEDGIKYGICDPCWQQLIQYNEFKERCIRANELSSDDNNDDDDEQTAEQHENESLHTDDEYEDSEYLDESQNDSDCDMRVEYLEENDSFDEENVYEPNVEVDRKKVQFDFTTILVKPIFALEIGKFCFFKAMESVCMRFNMHYIF